MRFLLALCFLAAMAYRSEGTTTCCPDRFLKVDDWCYYYNSEKKTWFDADVACRLLNAHLVSIHSMAESQEIYNVWTSFEDSSFADDRDRGYWIGFHDTVQEQSWEWTDGTDTSFKYWQHNEPNDDRGEDCAALRNEGDNEADRQEWNDYDCDERKSFMCKTPAV
ncbi:C-type lectin lectoxin-Thr1-like [Lytechinus variegatus]|uniref:C-type lectin lectoxin-Thr1-like n=1 Tax=Lytechinus variegatus TaxID=7654 RepID=UPI001BB1853F|nr:C-type lectin lectoxin-Thr1-like [Lytechinus variegatus]